MASSSSSSVILGSKYDVFLSFRGEDTRLNFTGHLYAALCQKSIAAFIDDDELKKGDEISPALSEAIEESKISVIIFSKDYASSTWCLDELAKITECRKKKGQVVIPVFYHVTPSDVRKQTGSFEVAFREHEERFKEMPERVQRWRAALTEAADLAGYDSSVIRSEFKLVEEIVRDILKKLTEISPLNDNCDGLVGIDSRIEKIKSLLLEYEVVGIWGMGGIGKTTIAKTLFSRISTQFEGGCFIENVREELEKHGGRLVQQKIISKILGEESLVIEAFNIIPQFIKDRLNRKKVLIVLDDVTVNNYIQLKLLIGGLEPLGDGSRIIITTRERQVISSYEMNKIYEVKVFNDDEALLLFCKCAFKQNYPPEHLQQLSNMILAYAKGNPLALEVLGFALCGKTKEYWESVVNKLEIIGGVQILDVLKISYDGLGKMEKSIFLDIACFFKVENKDLVFKVLEACYEGVGYLLSVLEDKSLIKISKSRVQMHDLLQEMGQRIVCQESEGKPGKRSRLWDHNDVYLVLQNNEGTDAVESILLDMSRIEEIHLSAKAFVNMTNIRLLKFYWPYGVLRDHVNISKVCLPQGLEYLPNELRYIRWDGYPLKELPLEFNLKKLVAIDFPYSNIEEIKKENKCALNFKSMISFPKHPIDFLKLLKVPSPIQCFPNLRYLNMRGCYSLRRFQRNIHFTSPITLDLSACINLREFPKISGNVKKLILERTAIEEVPPSISSLTELVHLDLNFCGWLKRISTSICKLRSLSGLFLMSCSRLESFPEILEEMECLKSVCLSHTEIKELPSTIKNLIGLETLSLDGCKKIKTIPNHICNLLNLKDLEVNRASVSRLASSIINRKELFILQLTLGDCNLTEFPEIIFRLSLLVLLNLEKNYFESLPRSIKQLSKLRFLVLNDCNMLQSIVELPLGLLNLDASRCERLQSLPEPPSNIEQLVQKCDDRWRPHMNSQFLNCFMLREKISRQRIQQTATAFRLYHGKANNETPKFFSILPGREMPEWFNHQSFGSSINIELPENWCDKGLIGFAFSTVLVVVIGRPLPDRIILIINCSYGNHTNALDFPLYLSGISGDHMVIGFVDVTLLKGHHKKVTFDFHTDYPIDGVSSHIDNPIDEEPLQIRSCGVCPLYEEPNMAKPSTSTETFASTAEDLEDTILSDDASMDGDLEDTMSEHRSNGRGIGDGSSNDEGVEPHPKRICRIRVNSP